jgi:hypothetical protein
MEHTVPDHHAVVATFVAVNKLLRWLRTTPAPRPHLTCPVCDQPVVIAGLSTKSFSGIMFVPPTRPERIAACPTHGRTPQNTLSLQALQREPGDQA